MDREAYVLEREINVTRRVTVVGHPAFLPNIDAGGGGAVRAFHVLVRMCFLVEFTNPGS